MTDQPFRGKKLLAFAPLSSYGGFNTSEHRIHALRELGFDVTVVDSKDNSKPGAAKRFMKRASNQLFQRGLPVPMYGGREFSKRLLSKAADQSFDMLWLEKALLLDADTIEQIRRLQPTMRIMGFAPDDMNARHNQSQQFRSALRVYDHFLTTKSYNVEELGALGCPDVRFIGNGYDPRYFRPVAPDAKHKRSLGGSVGFIGTYESERASWIRAVAESGIRVRVWGGPWHAMTSPPEALRLEHDWLYWDDFATAVSAFRINLNFLRKKNRDLQTTRSVEIPACGGFMLSERSDEHLELFEEGVEAEYFSSREELVEKCRYYLKNESARKRIAKAGYQRCLRSGYSNQARLKTALQSIFPDMS